MKDIYEMLNDVDIDENEIGSMAVDDIEKENVKKAVKNKIRKNKSWKKKSLIAAAICLFLIGGIAAFGITNPTYAANIPVVGDIFRFLDNGKTGLYDKFKENVNEINVTKNSNGISVTIDDALFDGRTLYYTYEIKSDKDLGMGSDVYLNNDLRVKGYYGGMTGSSQIKKINDATYKEQGNSLQVLTKSSQIKKMNDTIYIGQDSYTIDKERRNICFQLNIKSITNMVSKNPKEIKGNWNFNINLKAIKSTMQYVDKSTAKDGVKINITGISKTPATFSINYSQTISDKMKEKWFDVYTDLEVKDDLGNVYKGEDNGGSGDSHTLNLRKTFGKLNGNAHKLIISPVVHMSNQGGGGYTDKDGKNVEFQVKIDKNHPAKGSVQLNDIAVDLVK